MKGILKKISLLSVCAVLPLCFSSCAAGGWAGNSGREASAGLSIDEKAEPSGQDQGSSSGEEKAGSASKDGTAAASSDQSAESASTAEGAAASSSGAESSEGSSYTRSSFSGRNRWYSGDYQKYTQEDYKLILSFCVDGYQDKTVAEFDKSVMNWEDETAYHKMEDTLKRLYYGLPRDDPKAVFIFGTLSNTWDNCERKHYETCERQKTPWYSGYSVFETFGDVYGDQVCLTGAYADFDFDYEMADENAITVGERDSILRSVEDGLSEFMSGQPAQTLRDEEAMEKTLKTELEKHLKTLGNGKLSWGGSCDLSYWWNAPWEEWYDDDKDDDDDDDDDETDEEEIYQSGYTQEQYRYVLEKLQYDGYEKLAVADFDRMINELFSSYDEEWDKFQRAYEKVSSYLEEDDPAYSFLHDSVPRALEEYTARARTVYSGKEYDPSESDWISLERTEDVFGDAVSIGMLEGDYTITYRILDAGKLTVGQRDRFFEDVESFTKAGLKEALEAGEVDESILKKVMMKAGEKAATDSIKLIDCKVEYLELKD